MTSLGDSALVPSRYQISVIFTDECNMRCTYCTTPKRNVFITDAIIDRIVTLLERAAPATIDLNYHGGEPTLVWPQIERLTAGIAAMRRERRMSLNLCTNGTHLDDDRARFLREEGFDVRVSIDGREDTHTRFRRAPDRHSDETARALHQRSLSGLRTLIRNEVNTAVNMVVTPDTVKDLLSNAVFLIKQGLVHLVISPVVGMPWHDEALLELDRQLRDMTRVWRHWMTQSDARKHEDLRRSLLSEIDRCAYCIGLRMNQPDARILVIGPDGRIFGDEPDARTEGQLVLGHVDEVERLADVPPLKRSGFQIMYDRELYRPDVLRDVKRTHRLLRNRMCEIYAVLFPSHPMTIVREAG
jgi:sulfatase maturation enzyme AslB (radical SAM superfamily)